MKKKSHLILEPEIITMSGVILDSVSENLGVVALTLMVIYIWKLFAKPRNLPAGPIPWPLVGNLGYFQHSSQMYKDYERLGKEYGDVTSLYFGRRLHVVLNKYSVIREAFVGRGFEFNDRDPKLMGNDYEDFADDIFNCPYSEKYRTKKKFAMKALKTSGFGTKASEEKIMREVHELINWIDGQKGEAFDIEDAFNNIHANVLFSTLLSKRYPWFSDDMEKVLTAGREFYSVIECCTDGALNIAPQYLPMWLVRLIFRNRLKEKVYGGFNNSRAIIMDAIRDKRSERLDRENPRDFLEIYLTQKEDLDEKMFTSTVCMFVPEAIEGQAVLSLWVILHLCHNPGYQARCQEEIDEVCGSREPSLEDCGKLHLVSAAIWEATRLGVILPMSLAHIVARETTFRGYTIPRDNTCVIANFYAAHRDPEVFPDPETFNPDRFLDEDGKFHKADTVMTYGIGTRMSPGKAMSEAQMFLIIAHLLQRYTLSFPRDSPPPSTEAMPGNLFRRPDPFKILATPR